MGRWKKIPIQTHHFIIMEIKRPLALGLLFFITGELTLKLLAFNYIFIIPVILVAGIILKESRKYTKEDLKIVYLLLFLMLFLGIMHAAGYLVRVNATNRSMAKYEDKEVTLEGRIISVKEGDYYHQLIIKVENIRLLARVKIEDDRDAFMSGDFIRIKGVINRIDQKSNPGSFDQREYYKAKGIYYQISGKVRGHKKGTDILETCKKKMEEGLLYILPLKEAGILSAMILGDKSYIDKEIRTIYQMNGIAHILAISGLHIALISEALYFLFISLTKRRRLAAFLTMVLLLIYGFLTGFAEATLRAVIMMGVIMLGRMAKRSADSFTSLSLALFISVLIWPYSLSSAGLIMSYLSVLSVIVSSDIYKRIFRQDRFLYLPLWLRKYFKYFIRTFLLGLCMNAFMLGTLLSNYYGIPTYALIFNMIIGPFISVAVIFGFIGILIFIGMGFFSNDLAIVTGKIAAYPSYLVLRAYEWLGRICLKLPASYISTGHISVIGMVIFLILLLGVLCIIYKFVLGESRHLSKRKKYIFSVALFFLYIGIVAGTTKFANHLRSRIVFLDVGQGDSSIVHLYGGGNYIIDCGSSSVKNVGYYELIPALKYYGISEVDMIFISHTDEDHINGLLELLEYSEIEKIRIKKIAFSRALEEEGREMEVNVKGGEGKDKAKGNEEIKKSEDENLSKLLYHAKRLGAEVVYLSAGDSLEKGDLTIKVLGPVDPYRNKNKNDNSLLITFNYKNVKVFYTGDISTAAEDNIAYSLLGEEDLFILKCPHHGAASSLSKEFLDKVPCDICVISVGENNHYGHPAKETLERLKKAACKIYRTDTDGAVVIGWGKLDESD